MVKCYKKSQTIENFNSRLLDFDLFLSLNTINSLSKGSFIVGLGSTKGSGFFALNNSQSVTLKYKTLKTRNRHIAFSRGPVAHKKSAIDQIKFPIKRVVCYQNLFKFKKLHLFLFNFKIILKFLCSFKSRFLLESFSNFSFYRQTLFIPLRLHLNIH